MARKFRNAHGKKNGCKKKKTSCCHGSVMKNGTQVGKKAKKYNKTVDGLKSDCSVCELQSRSRGAASVVLEAVEAEMGAVGTNPFSFTTSCAPDAQSFHFICQSCSIIRFATYEELRLHEDWCARIRAGKGFICGQCSRLYRTLGTLRRHSEDAHRVVDSSQVKKTAVVGNPFLFSTTIATDAESYPHVCSSCELLCFSTASDLRKHENWCGQSVTSDSGFTCSKCTRRFRTRILLERHSAAADCMKKLNAVETKKDIKAASVGRNTEQKPRQETAVHSICPLCDEPCLTPYEQKVHFLAVHSITSSELKIKASVQRLSKLGHVTCLDCDAKFASRLELVQHKRSCTKLILPKYVTPAIQPPCADHGKTLPPVTGRLDLKKPITNTKTGDKQNPDKETMLVDASCKCTAALKEKSKSTKPGSLNSTAIQTKSGHRRPQTHVSQKLVLNMTEVRQLVKSTGAKRLLLKPDGQVVLMGEGGSKIARRNGKSLITRVGRNSGSSIRACSKMVNIQSIPVCKSKPKHVTRHVTGGKLMPAIPMSSAQSIATNRPTEDGQECHMDHSIGEEDVEHTEEVLNSTVNTKIGDSLAAASDKGVSLVPLKRLSCQTSLQDQVHETTGETKNDKQEIKDSDEAIRHEEEDLGVERGAVNVGQTQDCSEIMNPVVHNDDEKDYIPTNKVTCHDTSSIVTCVTPGTKTRKRSLHHETTPVIDLTGKNHVSAIPGNAVKNSSTSDKGVVLVPLKRLLNVRNRIPLTDHSEVTVSDPVASESKTEVTVSNSQSSSKVVEGQEMLLHALKLVPVTNKPLVSLKAKAVQYCTRSSLVASGVKTSKRLRMDDSASSKMSSSRSSGHKALKSLATGIGFSEETEDNKGKRLVEHASERSSVQSPRKRQTVETVDESSVRCVTCKTVFQTARQIVHHMCTIT